MVRNTRSGQPEQSSSRDALDSQTQVPDTTPGTPTPGTTIAPRTTRALRNASAQQEPTNNNRPHPVPGPNAPSDDEVDPYDPPQSSHPRTALSDQASIEQNRQRSENPSTQALNARNPSLRRSIEDASSDDEDNLPAAVLLERAARIEAKAALSRARASLREAQERETGAELAAQQRRTISVAEPARAASMHPHDKATAFLRDFPRTSSRAESTAAWADNHPVGPLIDEGLQGPSLALRAAKSVTMPLREYNLKEYTGKDQRELDLWEENLREMWKWSRDRFANEEELVSHAARHLSESLQEAWRRHARATPTAAADFQALITFLRGYLGDPVQRTAKTYKTWRNARQGQTQTSLEFLQYLRSIEAFIPVMPDEVLAIHYLDSLQPDLGNAVRRTGRVMETREQIQAIAATIEEPTRGNLSKRAKESETQGGGDNDGRDEKRKKQGDNNRGGRGGRGRGRGRGGWTSNNRSGSQNRGDPPTGTAAANNPASTVNNTPVGTNNGRANVHCYNCSQKGHLSNECPVPRKAKFHGVATDEDPKNEPASP